MSGLVKIWDQPIKGRLFAVGDIHGSYNLLMNTLKKIGFDFENDLLCAVSDLVDRGTQNIECLELLSQPWFTSVRGNHEDLLITGLGDQSHKNCHIANGGEWFYALDEQTQANLASICAKLPIAIEFNHNGKKFGIVHGHIEQNDWKEFKQSFSTPKPFSGFMRDPAQLAMWGRERLNPEAEQYARVSGVDAVIMGHTVTHRPCKRDNCIWIDTGAVHNGNLTIIELK